MTTADTNTHLVVQAFDALNERDPHAFADVHAENVAVHAFGEEYHGIEEVVEEEFGMFDGFSDLEYSLDATVADEETVAARWTAVGTHDGPFGEIQPTEKTVDFQVMGMFRVGNERIADAWILPDRLGLMEQLGVVDGSGE